MICGVDEAGKGSVLGPMVVAGVGVPAEDVLDGLPVRDSKILSLRQRETLYGEIIQRCRIATIIISPEKIDVSRARISMNECVARAHAAAIMALEPDIAFVDACDVNEIRYARMVSSFLPSPCRIVSEHKADETYRIVSAASIVAKVVRDREVDLLKEEYGAVGSGYPSDPETIAFLEAYVDEHHRPPACARKSWKTITALIAKRSQTNLF